MYNGKYIKLFDYLNGQPSDVCSLTLNIKEIEEIVTFKLPDSAYKHSAWWSNEAEGTHTHARSWSLAGWKTLNVKPGECVTFERKTNEKRSSQSVNAAIGEYLVLAELLKRDFTAFLANGPNQADWDVIISSQQYLKKVQVKAIDWPKNRAVNIVSYQRRKFDILVIVLLNKPDLEDTESKDQFLIIPDADIEKLLSEPNENRLNIGRTITVNKKIIDEYKGKWSLV